MRLWDSANQLVATYRCKSNSNRASVSIQFPAVPAFRTRAILCVTESWSSPGNHLSESENQVIVDPLHCETTSILRLKMHPARDALWRIRFATTVTCVLAMRAQSCDFWKNYSDLNASTAFTFAARIAGIVAATTAAARIVSADAMNASTPG